MPSIFHKTPVGELPLITISFLLSSGVLIPAKLAAKRAGSLLPPAYLFTSSMEKVRALTVAILLILEDLLDDLTTTSFKFLKSSSKLISNIVSLPEFITTLVI